jgi:glycosyltransferase involved in cell wall biosynthesis
MNKSLISCIVPVYNEGPRVIAVLDAIMACQLVDEIIVINDGSTDNTESLLAGKAGINLISYKPNQGKSHAVKVGLQAARNDMVMMIDSDLKGLDADAIAALILPVELGGADMTISLRKNALYLYKLFGLDFVSGERVFRKSIIRDLEHLEILPGFALESYLNQIVINTNLRIKIVNWPNVISPRKSVKNGLWEGLKGDLRMVGHITKYLTPLGTFRMYIDMLKRRV